MSELRIVGKHGLNDKGQGYFFSNEDYVYFRLGERVYEVFDPGMELNVSCDLPENLASSMMKVFNSPLIVADDSIIEVVIQNFEDPEAGLRFIKRDRNTLEDIESSVPQLLEVPEDDEELYCEVISRDVK